MGERVGACGAAGRLAVGVRLHDLAPAPLEQRIQMAAQQGFSCIHLASKLVYEAYGCGAEGLTPGLAAHIRRVCEAAGIEIAVFGCYRNLCAPEPLLEQELAQYAACLRFGRWLGAHVVGTETGRPNAQNVVEPSRHSDAALETFVAGLTRAAKLAEHAGMMLAFEPGFGEVCHTPERARYALDTVESEALGLIWDPVAQLDPVHAASKDYQRSMAERMIELCGAEVMVLHAKDFDAAKTVGAQSVSCTGPGITGAYDYAPVAAWAAAAKPHIACVIENSTPETAAASRAYLEGLDA